jgi:transcriptional regulator with PAS, ATPase and Fis domain
MKDVFSLMQMVARHNVNVLITGPTGSGKELVARALHKEYGKELPFVAVNCAAIPENLLESELFGYVKGAFTGASMNRKGKIELANHGTLFLDEIGDMPLSLQSKLLRVIQERCLTPVGAEKEIQVSVRIVAATNMNLKKMTETNKFRRDLFFRLNVIHLKIPSLKDRIADIPLLINHFIKKFNNKFNKDISGISNEALNMLQLREWTGNVRELENEIERAVLLTRKNVIDIDCLQEIEGKNEFSMLQQIPIDWKSYQSYRFRFVKNLDKHYLDMLLDRADGNIKRASETGNLTRKQVYRLIEGQKELNLDE